MRFFTSLFLIPTSVLLLISNAAVAGDDNVLVVKTNERMETEFVQLAELFKYSGTAAVAERIHEDMANPQTVDAWKKFVSSGNMRLVDVDVHPNEAKAVEWINTRFKRMGIPNLEFNGVENEQAPDPTALPEDKIKGRKWLRYLAGPGVAMTAAYIGLPEGVHANGSDYLYMIIPAVGVGVTTVALELQFAWPWLNNVFWKKVWRFGGAFMGRVTNTTVNFLYGMALYGAGVGSAHLPLLWGGAPVPFETMSFTAAMASALVGGVTFHIAMGQFQTDLSTEEERGTISGPARYGLETTGVVVNNGARVFDWIIPGSSGAIAQGAFFLLKTLPQLITTHVAHRLQDAEVKNTLTGKPTSLLNKCGQFFSKVSLLNLPKQRKE